MLLIFTIVITLSKLNLKITIIYVQKREILASLRDLNFNNDFHNLINNKLRVLYVSMYVKIGIKTKYFTITYSNM